MIRLLAMLGFATSSIAPLMLNANATVTFTVMDVVMGAPGKQRGG